MQFTMSAYQTVNELFRLLSALSQGELERTAMVELLVESLMTCVPSSRYAVERGEMSCLHNLLCLSAAGCKGELVGEAWRRVMRWPHAPVKFEPFLVNHVYKMGKESQLLEALVAAVKAVPELRVVMRRALTPASLHQSCYDASNSACDGVEWFMAPLPPLSSAPPEGWFVNGAHVRSFILQQIDNDGTVMIVNFLFGGDMVRHGEKAQHPHDVQVCLEWALSPQLPRNYLTKTWTLLHAILAKCKPNHYSCDLILPNVHRQVERVLKKANAKQADCLPIITQCLLLMTCRSSLFMECLWRLSSSLDVQVIRLVCQYFLDYNIKCPERFVTVIAHGLLVNDVQLQRLITSVIQTSDCQLARTIPFPLDDPCRLSRAVDHAFWCSLLLQHYLRHRDAAVLASLPGGGVLEAGQLGVLMGSVAEGVAEGVVAESVFDRLLSRPCC